MTDNIVTFGGNKPDEPELAEKFLFKCGHCDCRTFNLYSGGIIRCSYCNGLLKVHAEDEEDLESWVKMFEAGPDKPDEVPEDTGNLKVSQLGDASLARRRTMKRVNDWGADLVMVGGYNRSGAGSHWFDVSTEEQREWMKGHLKELYDHVDNMKLDMAETLTTVVDNGKDVDAGPSTGTDQVTGGDEHTPQGERSDQGYGDAS